MKLAVENERPESPEAEGFESFAHFRRAWCIREKRLFRPMHMTTVFRVRRWDSEDERAMADALLERLLPPVLDTSHDV
jgi:hypothetical protein